MINLLDTTFAIIFKADSAERIENLKMVFKNLVTTYDAYINIIEIGLQPLLDTFFSNTSNQHHYSFAYDEAIELNMTKYRNQQIKACKTEFIALWDTDVIIEKKQVQDALTMLRSKSYQVALPYNGNLIEINPILKSIFKKNNSLSLIKNILKDRKSMYGNISVGAAVIFNTQFYQKAGMDNRAFTKWGHDDIERIKRVEILGASIYRSFGCAYHLYHPRFSYGNNNENAEHQTLLSRGEMIFIASLLPDQLKKYIENWTKDNL